MPDLGDYAAIMDGFVESGRFAASFNGPAPLTWLDIWAYGQAACGPVPASINRIWLAMSRAYVTELALAIEPMRPSPAEQDDL